MSSNKIIWYTLIILGLIIIYLIPIVIYVASFSDPILSTSADNWGWFGSFLDGVLSPVFSLINIIVLVYISYEINSINNKQNESLAKAEAKRHQMKIKGEVHMRIIEILSKINEINFKDPNLFENPIEIVKSNLIAVFYSFSYLFPELDFEAKLKQFTDNLTKLKNDSLILFNSSPEDNEPKIIFQTTKNEFNSLFLELNKALSKSINTK